MIALTMDEKTRVSLSRFLSRVLRHRPESIGIELDNEGWVSVDALITACQTHRKPLSRYTLEEIVATNPKQRFAFSQDGCLIRANQGHSVEVDLTYEPQSPPEHLFHGTPEKFVSAIRKSGLQKIKRHHVHLSPDQETASKVGARRGRPVILRIESGQMSADGHLFYRSANGVWLVGHVPVEYIIFPS